MQRFLLAWALLAASLFALEGRVFKVSDGDTLTIIVGKKQKVNVRLSGIDAPEIKQSYGRLSRNNLGALCNKKKAVVDEEGQDQYGRTLGVVYCEGVNANERQVSDGFAWAYLEYSDLYTEAENAARDERKGLWSEDNPIEPSVYRAMNRRKK
jgi:endonuclease YncB( thermonuclease family)